MSAAIRVFHTQHAESRPLWCLIGPHSCASLQPPMLPTSVPVVQQEETPLSVLIKAEGPDCVRVPVMQQQEEEAAKRQAERAKRPAKRVAVPKHGTVRMQEPTEVRATLCSTSIWTSCGKMCHPCQHPDAGSLSGLATLVPGFVSRQQLFGFANVD